MGKTSSEGTLEGAVQDLCLILGISSALTLPSVLHSKGRAVRSESTTALRCADRAPQMVLEDGAESAAELAALMSAEDQLDTSLVNSYSQPASASNTVDSLTLMAGLPCSLGVAMSVIIDRASDSAMQNFLATSSF